MQTAGAAKGNRDFRYRRYAGSSTARQSSCDRDSAEQTMLRMIPRQDHLKDRVGPPRQAGEGCQDAWTVILVQAVKFADWTFRHLCAGVERTFEHVLAMRGHQQIGSKTADNVEGLAKPPISNANMEPAVAWRLIAVPAASPLDTPAMAMVHQRAQPDPVSTQQGGYGRSNGGIGCMSSIVESTVTVFRATNLAPTVAPLIPPETRPGTSAGPTTAAPVIPAAVLPVDLAVSSDGQTFAVVAAGNGKTAALPGVYLLARTSTGDLVDDGNGCATDMVHTAVPGQATAVALATHRVAWVQTREPAGLFQVTAHPDGTANVTASIVLSKESREDTGHSIVHSNSGAFIACASCHAEGGDDGRIWRFADSDGGSASPARRTQTLRGTLADTAPYHWEGDMKDITMLAHEVFVTRMDGQTLDADQDAALKAWLVAVPAPVTSPPADASAAARGRALFASPGVGCTACHNGPKLTNNQTLNVGLGGMFQVPSLIGVGWRAPYLHDGRALQLVDRFNPLIGGGDLHGRTTQLTTAEIDDLVPYLQTL